MIKSNFGGHGAMVPGSYGVAPTAPEHQSASNSNSANGGSVNSQDSLWNVKGAPAMQSQDPAMMHMMNAYQMQSQGYPVYDAMAMQQHPGQQQQQQQQLQQQQLQQYPEDYTHYPHPEEYLNERNQQFLNGGEFYRHIPRPDGNSDYSPYGENLTPEQAYHLQMQANGGFEEPQTPTQNYGQMSFEDAIDGGQHSGSYNAGQQQRRIIREIIV